MVVGVIGADTALRDLHQPVARIITISDGVAVQSFAEGIAVVIVGIDGTALLLQPVITVIGVSSVDTVDDFINTVAHRVVLIACAVVAIDQVGDGLAGKAVEIVVDVVGDSAAVFGEADPSAGGI